MHKVIGILGGMSPESTIAYYEYITRTYTQRYGDYGYPEILIYSVSFQPYVDWPQDGRWDLVEKGLAKAASKLETAGADFILIATNTMHLVFGGMAVLLMMLFIGFGAAARGKVFRIYSILTILTILGFGAWAGMQGTQIAAGPVPWFGVIERVSYYSPMHWVFVLAAVLLCAQANAPQWSISNREMVNLQLKLEFL